MASEFQLTYPFTREMVEEQAKADAAVLILVSAAYAKSLGQDVRGWALFAGKLVSPSWTGITSPLMGVTAVALNCAAAGLSVVSVTGDDTRGETVTGDWPDPEDLSMLGLSQAEADQCWSIYEPVAQSLGYTFSWSRQNNQLHFVFAK